ncbi:MAG: DegT/DnrJ/EryC1/StrS family aminotransferase [Bacteroidales bacterium]|nr:DegT/DnrJ/EryC1/StrS family aminotransferase [Bacteroidales bacterium]
MRIPYYSPNYSFFDFIKSFFITNAEDKTIKYFQQITDKKYILLTSSCRTALYLAYRSISPDMNIVSTSPLTCRAAIDPIIAAGHTIRFVDINTDDLNIDIANEDVSEFDIVQIARLGGMPLINKGLFDFCKSKGVFVIEDCAQSFMTYEDRTYTGQMGDISCFSLIKNAYGIGGGVFATDKKDIFIKARAIQHSMKSISKKIVYYRCLKNILETYRMRSYLIEKFYIMLINYKNKKLSENKTFDKYLYKPDILFFNTFIVQKGKFKKLHKKRKAIALKIIKELKGKGLCDNYQNSDIYNSSFTKLYVYSTAVNTNYVNEALNREGVESKHLEHKYKSYYQQSLINIPVFNSTGIDKCVNYLKVHDSLISLPLNENMNNKHIHNIIMTLKKIIYDYEANEQSSL